MSETTEQLVLKQENLKRIIQQVKAGKEALQKELKALKFQSSKLGELVDTVLTSVVSIYVIDWEKQNNIALGSGFFVDSDVIITNFHVVADVADEDSIYEEDEGQLVLVATHDGELRIGQVVFTGNSELDLAILLATDYIIDPKTGEETENADPEYPILEFCPYIDAGQRVIAVGYPGGELASTICQGVVQEIRYPDNYGENEDQIGVVIVQTTATINSFNSGGPLINLEGEVVGVNCYKKAKDTETNLAIYSDVLDDFLDKFAETFEVD